MDGLPLAEIEARLMLLDLLEPISRGTHLAGPRSGPRLYAEHLVEAWKADGAVTLGAAYQLLDVKMVAGVILRAVAAEDYDQDDPSYWPFPPVADLLAPLREVAWQEILAGNLVLEAIPGVTGREHRPLAVTELPRLAPDFELSRLTRDGRDEFIDVRVHPMSATDIPPSPDAAASQGNLAATETGDSASLAGAVRWIATPPARPQGVPEAALRNALLDIVDRHPAGSPPLDEESLHKEVERLLEATVARDRFLAARKEVAPHFKLPVGRPRKNAQ